MIAVPHRHHLLLVLHHVHQEELARNVEEEGMKAQHINMLPLQHRDGLNLIIIQEALHVHIAITRQTIIIIRALNAEDLDTIK